MKKRKIRLFIAVSVLFLSACTRQSDLPSPVIIDSEPSEQPDSIQSSEDVQLPVAPSTVIEDDTQPPHDGMVRSRLTNEWVEEEVANTRPIAVMIPNENNALPHYSLSDASVLYEANVEGSMTRLMAVYEDWQELPKIGNIRSLRAYYAYWAFEWDAFIVHSGQPFFVDDLLAEPTTQTINEGNYSDSAAFFRDETKMRPHNAYATGQGILSVINAKGYSLEYRGLTEQNHFRFTTKAAPNTLEQYDEAKNAYYIDMSGCYPLTRCYFDYNEQDGLYYRSQHLSSGTDGPHIDAATGRQLSFKNILVQYVTYEDLGEGYLAFQCHDNTKDGWYFTNGKGIHVTWEKSEDYGATRFYDDYGNEIILNTGKTMICIAEDGDNFTFR